MQDLKIFDRVIWSVTESLSDKDCLFIEDLDGYTFSSNKVQEFLNTEIDIKDEDKIIILETEDGKPALTTYINKPKSQYRVIDVLESIETIMNTPIKPGVTYIKPCVVNYFEDGIDVDEFICKEISRYYYCKEKLTKKYENGRLYPGDFLGDSIYFEGIYRVENYLFINRGS